MTVNAIEVEELASGWLVSPLRSWYVGSPLRRSNVASAGAAAALPTAALELGAAAGLLLEPGGGGIERAGKIVRALPFGLAAAAAAWGELWASVWVCTLHKSIDFNSMQYIH
jgi:hypothetical protein